MATDYTWKRQNGPTGETICGATHYLMYKGEDTGMWIDHCGHPTALWPYSFFDGNIVTHGVKGLRKLKANLEQKHREEEQ